MKKYICLLLVIVLCFGIVGCGGSYDSVNIDKEPEIFDFHIPDWVSWGMKEGEVRQHFENERIYDMGISTAVIQISQEDMYRDCFVDESYHFGSSNSLYKMEYVFEKSYDPTDLHANQYYEIYSEIKQKMLEEYGEPIEDKETWHNDARGLCWYWSGNFIHCKLNNVKIMQTTKTFTLNA